MRLCSWGQLLPVSSQPAPGGMGKNQAKTNGDAFIAVSSLNNQQHSPLLLIKHLRGLNEHELSLPIRADYKELQILFLEDALQFLTKPLQ